MSTISQIQSQQQHSPTLHLSKPKKKKRLTHTNTDKECLRNDAGFLRRLIYTIDIHNGFKFFSIAERTVLYVIIWLCCSIIATYSYVFLQGMYDGITTLPIASSEENIVDTVSSTTTSASSEE